MRDGVAVRRTLHGGDAQAREVVRAPLHVDQTRPGLGASPSVVEIEPADWGTLPEVPAV
mgnify:CR=1 FL=1